MTTVFIDFSNLDHTPLWIKLEVHNQSKLVIKTNILWIYISILTTYYTSISTTEATHFPESFPSTKLTPFFHKFALIVQKGLIRNFQIIDACALDQNKGARKIQKLAGCSKGENGLSFPANGRAGHQRVPLVRQKEENILPLAQNLRSDEPMVSCKHQHDQAG